MEVGEHYHDDCEERGCTFGIHHDSPNSEVEALDDEHVAQYDGQGECEGGEGWVQPGHEVHDDHECRGQRELHGLVLGHTRHDVGGEHVHPQRALPCQHGLLLQEHEHSIEGHEDSP
jgi:hypothetical protein